MEMEANVIPERICETVKTPMSYLRRRSSLYISTGKVRSPFKSPKRSLVTTNDATESNDISSFILTNEITGDLPVPCKRRKRAIFSTLTKGTDFKDELILGPTSFNIGSVSTAEKPLVSKKECCVKLAGIYTMTESRHDELIREEICQGLVKEGKTEVCSLKQETGHDELKSEEKCQSLVKEGKDEVCLMKQEELRIDELNKEENCQSLVEEEKTDICSLKQEESRHDELDREENCQSFVEKEKTEICSVKQEESRHAELDREENCQSLVEEEKTEICLLKQEESRHDELDREENCQSLVGEEEKTEICSLKQEESRHDELDREENCQSFVEKEKTEICSLKQAESRHAELNRVGNWESLFEEEKTEICSLKQEESRHDELDREERCPSVLEEGKTEVCSLKQEESSIADKNLCRNGVSEKSTACEETGTKFGHQETELRNDELDREEKRESLVEEEKTELYSLKQEDSRHDELDRGENCQRFIEERKPEVCSLKRKELSIADKNFCPDEILGNSSAFEEMDDQCGNLEKELGVCESLFDDAVPLEALQHNMRALSLSRSTAELCCAEWHRYKWRINVY